MEYQKIIIMLVNTPNQPSEIRRGNWVEINVDTRETYNTNSQVKFKTSLLKSSLCTYSDAYIVLKGTLTVLDMSATADDKNSINKRQRLHNWLSTKLYLLESSRFK